MGRSAASALLLIPFLVLFRPGNSPASDQPDPQAKALATVNGVPITEYDLDQSVKRSPHGERVSGPPSKIVLESVVRDELIYQRALELGLDKNPAYRRKLMEAEAQLRAFQRENLKVLFREYVWGKTEVSDADALAYFHENGEKIRSKIRIWQIFYKGEPEKIRRDEQDLKRGVPFEQVVSRRYPNLPTGTKAPWDLGYLHWSQIPEEWQEVVYKMTPGQVSDVLTGQGGRSWIIKIIDKAPDPEVTFDNQKARIVEILKRQRREELYDAMLDQMQKKSQVVLSE